MGYADKFFSKLISKKLFVFLLATVMFFLKMITSDQWFMITMLWMGGVAVIDIVGKLKAKV
jgi:hypothetical protein